MSYCIKVGYFEKETLIHVEIYGTSEEYRSTRISQFQCIGWLLGIFDHAKNLVKSCNGDLDAGYDQEALERVAALSSAEASHLISLRTLNDRFEYVWEVIGESERNIAQAMDFNAYDNFWPGFDTYSRIWNSNQTPVTELDFTVDLTLKQ